MSADTAEPETAPETRTDEPESLLARIARLIRTANEHGVPF
ncbi:hypothetical protein [Actinokineospora sp. NPDC004072]